MSKFGWSLPAGCNTLPDEEPEPPYAYQCPTCGCFMRMEPSRSVPYKEMDDYGEIIWADVIDFYKCSNCLNETPNPIALFE